FRVEVEAIGHVRHKNLVRLLGYCVEGTQRCISVKIVYSMVSTVNLVDWLKMMVGSRRSEEVVDPSIETRPSTRALKRALLTALRCVDPDSEKRPKMGQVVRMLDSDEPIPREV
ncbi:hypothetical protein BHE74_00004326, partial [Ensete ventricosum]